MYIFISVYINKFFELNKFILISFIKKKRITSLKVIFYARFIDFVNYILRKLKTFFRMMFLKITSQHMIQLNKILNN